MGLFEKKQEKMSPKGEPKPSGFRERPFLRREEFRNWLKKEEAWRVSKMLQKERVSLEKNI